MKERDRFPRDLKQRMRTERIDFQKCVGEGGKKFAFLAISVSKDLGTQRGKGVGLQGWLGGGRTYCAFFK